jgi:hypothetical protein
MPAGSVAVMLLSLDCVTVSGLAPSVTLGVSKPNPVPAMVIAVPGVFSVTFTMIGKSEFCAAARAELQSNMEAKSAERLNMIDLLGRYAAWV